MPKADYQRNAFLGGEVSPSLYERVDMDQFSRWFSKAENIRFQDTGGFRSRPGFKYIAKTKNNKDGEIIKLISFSFNSEESFLVEFGPGYARFFRNGQPVMSGQNVYEIKTPFLSFNEQDIKYAQAGDIIYITHPQYGIYELVRKNVLGTEWEMKPFSAKHLPMGYENSDKTNTLSLTSTTNFQFVQSIKIPATEVNDDLFYYPKLYVDNVLTWEPNLVVDGSQCALGMAFALSSSSVNVYYNNHTFTFASTNELNISLRFEAQRYRIGKYSVSVKASEYYHDRNEVFKNPDRVVQVSQTYDTDYVEYVKSASVKARVSYDNGATYQWDERSYSSTDTISFTNSILSIIQQNQGFSGSSVGLSVRSNVFTNGNSGFPLIWGSDELTLNTTTFERYNISVSAENMINPERPIYSLGADNSDNFFYDNNIGTGDEISVTHIVGAQHIEDNVYQPHYTSTEIFSDGHWRLYCTGVWVGAFTLYYSTDNKHTWHECYSWSSKTQGHASGGDGMYYYGATEWPNNPNTSGVVESDSTVWFRVTGGIDTNVPSSVTQNAMNLCVGTDTYSANSYYRILAVTSGNSAIVEAVQNDTGTFSQESRWKTQAFSQSAGWPQTVGFYQNRLFFGKDYLLYGSKTNDFSDFYEPIKMQDDDPLSLSLLSSKVNNIKNIVTQRSFFVFTGGGEFGIGSEGALTQKDRYLKPFSANGSASCLPVLMNEVVLFVDKSERAVRALKYTLESDGYEAPDITLALTYLLRNERIISTDTIFEEKEALFLSETGTIWVLKYITDQNVLSWSHWKHAYGKITNICVVPNGAKNDLYVAVESPYKGKWIEKLTLGTYMDTFQEFDSASGDRVSVAGAPGDKRIILQDDQITNVEIAADNTIPAPANRDAKFLVGSIYVSIGTLLTPTIPTSEFSHTTYAKRTPFKVWFYYTNSYGFKVGVEEDEKMQIDFNQLYLPLESETNLTSGKKSVNIPSRFDGSARVSFVQDTPFPMEIQDALIEMDFGGK